MLAAVSSQASAQTIAGVTSDNTYITFDAAAPDALLTGKPIAGLALNEVVRGIDFRPTTGELYALGSFGNVYTLDTTGIGVAQATLRFNLNNDANLIAAGGLSGASFGFDFNPAADHDGGASLRIVSNTDQNLAVNVDTGAVTLATPVSYGGSPDPNVVAVAYTNAVPGGIPGGVGGPPGTQQYVIDSGTDQLVLQAFNAGTLADVGSLQVGTTAQVGFDIYAPTTDLADALAFATLDANGSNTTAFYTIDLATGQATLIGEIGGGLLVPNITAFLAPEPGTVAILLAGLTLVTVRRRSA